MKINENNFGLPNIPKIMNFYWGGSKLSELNLLTIISFHKFNPDWEINLYTPIIENNDKTWITKEQKIEYIGDDYYNELEKLNYVNFIKFDFNDIGVDNGIPEVYKSDFIRWYLLYEKGGGWSDMDILYIKPINELNLTGNMLRGDIINTDTIITYDGFNHIIGFFLTKPKTRFFLDIFNMSKVSLNTQQYQSIGSTMLKTMFYDINTLINRYPDINFANLPMDYIYPYNDSNINIIFNENNLEKINKNTIGIHWYNGSEISKNFLNIKNNDTMNNTINNIIKNNNIN
jgi:mannosyltransferase OCH1-like enzyme